jgi:hypothetical protein
MERVDVRPTFHFMFCHHPTEVLTTIIITIIIIIYRRDVGR